MSKTKAKEKLQAYHAGRKPRVMKPSEDDYYYFSDIESDNEHAEFRYIKAFARFPFKTKARAKSERKT